MEEYESVLLVKNEVFVYNIPPLVSNKGYKASDWKLDQPEWTGRLKVVAKGLECILKLEDKNSGDLFATCPVDKYPGVAIEAVTDSSRYFVIRLINDDGRTAFIGMGFADRSDSFDLNVTLQDHFKWVEKSNIDNTATEERQQPALDLGFKDGETIKISVNFGKKSTARPRSERSTMGTSSFLPPPPVGVKLGQSSSTNKTKSEERLTNEQTSRAIPPGDDWIKF